MIFDFHPIIMLLITLFILKHLCTCGYSEDEISSIITCNSPQYVEFMKNNRSAYKNTEKIKRLNKNIKDVEKELEKLRNNREEMSEKYRIGGYSQKTIDRLLKVHDWLTEILENFDSRMKEKVKNKQRETDLIFCDLINRIN